MIDFLAYVVGAVALFVVLWPAIPTGVLGTLGTAAIGVCSVVIGADDAAIANTVLLERLLSGLMLGFILVVLHVLLRIWKAQAPVECPHRRASDWAPLDWPPVDGGEGAS